jgi:hypothetical protein
MTGQIDSGNLDSLWISRRGLHDLKLCCQAFSRTRTRAQ